MATKRPHNRDNRAPRGPARPDAESRPPPKRRGPRVPRKADGTFQKGVSGNPGGRPAEFVDFVKLAREKGSPRAFRTLLRQMRHGEDRAQVQAALGMLAYAWGKPKQAVELTGKDGGPVKTQTSSALPLPHLTDEELQALKTLAMRAAERAAAAAGGDAGATGPRPVA